MPTDEDTMGHTLGIQQSQQQNQADLADALAGKAVSLLQRAEAAGVFSRHPAAVSNLERLGRNPIFQKRADFRALLKKVNEKK